MIDKLNRIITVLINPSCWLQSWPYSSYANKFCDDMFLKNKGLTSQEIFIGCIEILGLPVKIRVGDCFKEAHFIETQTRPSRYNILRIYALLKKEKSDEDYFKGKNGHN